MRRLERLGKLLAITVAFALSGLLAHQFGTAGLWQGFNTALAVTKPGHKRPYDLTRLEAVNETLRYVRDRYVEPDRIKPRNMLLSALNYVQREVAEVIVLPATDHPGMVTLRVDTHDKLVRVNDVLGPWDVAARLREVFAFLQKHLKGSDVDLRDVEYAACNGLLHTLDPHSTFLSPDAYNEMNLSTSGQFGGLGIVISIRDQLLTIIRPMPGTPAGRAGLERLDRVMKIDNESTLNMPLDDAVRRLRGKPGTNVTVWIAREGSWQGTRKFVLTRERIKVPSVLHRRLDGDVAYVRLKQFQASSSAEIRQALEDIRNGGAVKGLVLDLRGNPGGLLEQAAKVADLFVGRGVLVATVGASEGREEKKASAVGTEPAYPMVVLVNGASASASEIVAGALKNLGRAVIMGETTFGKGSVQLVFPNVTPDKAALKLTIAQYLTPGDSSIQGVGVTPHIALDPMTVDELEMDLTVQHDGMRERDLTRHLSSSHAVKSGRPAQVVRYYLPRAVREKIRERGGELDDEFERDFPIAFATRLVKHLPAGKPAVAQLRAAGRLIDKTRAAELDKVSAALAKLGVDWSVPDAKPVPGPAKDDLVVTAKTDRPGNQVRAGQSIALEVAVTNNGSEPIYRLRATTDSDNPYFDEKELVFGKIEPGATVSARAPLSWCEVEGRRAGSTRPKQTNAPRVCKIPMDARTRSDGVKVHFDAAGGHAPASVEVRPSIVQLDRPLFQYSYQIADDIKGNGDGLLQRGERATMYLTVKNVGQGRSFETQANLANRSGDGVLLRAGRFDISNMKPGDVRQVAFTFDVQQQLKDSAVVLALSVGDRDLREVASEKIRIPIATPVPIAALDAPMHTTRAALLQGDALAARATFGRLANGTALHAVGRRGDLVKVSLGGRRFAFVRTAALGAGGNPSDAAPFDVIYGHAPPKLSVRASAVATRQDKVTIEVEAVDAERVLDTYLFVGPRKLFYRSNRKAADPKRASFSFEAPLQPGVNMIIVVARQSPDTTTRRLVVVRRDARDGSIMKTPKHQEDYLIDAVK